MTYVVVTKVLFVGFPLRRRPLTESVPILRHTPGIDVLEHVKASKDRIVAHAAAGGRAATRAVTPKEPRGKCRARGTAVTRPMEFMASLIALQSSAPSHSKSNGENAYLSSVHGKQLSKVHPIERQLRSLVEQVHLTDIEACKQLRAAAKSPKSRHNALRAPIVAP